ncbi:proteasome (prosome, macropain) inhibitor subunit 1, isoform CRA_c, partial [Mus musculus]
QLSLPFTLQELPPLAPSASVFLWAWGRGFCPCVCRPAGVASPALVRAEVPAAAPHQAAYRSHGEISVSQSPAPPHLQGRLRQHQPSTRCSRGHSAIRTERILDVIIKNQMSIQNTCCQSSTLLFVNAQTLKSVILHRTTGFLQGILLKHPRVTSYSCS